MILIMISIIILNVNRIACNCRTVCQTNRNCLQLCEQELQNPDRNPMSLGHCGLTDLDNGRVQSRIVHGATAAEHKYPWLVSLHATRSEFIGTVKFDKDLHFCGGVIINEQFILTAAHCFPTQVDKQNFNVMFGTNQYDLTSAKAVVMQPESNNPGIWGTLLGTESKLWVKVHEQYAQLSNDIALVKTDRPIEFRIENNKFIVNSVCLPTNHMRPTGLATLAGWGYTDMTYQTRPYKLQEIECKIISNDECYRVFNETRYYLNVSSNFYYVEDADRYVTDKVMCVISSTSPGLAQFHKSVATGDSGSGYYITKRNRSHVIGILSSIDKTLSNPTARLMRVTEFLDWIRDSMKVSLKDLT